MMVSGQNSDLATLSQREPPVPIGNEAGWAPESVWTRWRREEIPAPGGNGTPVVQPVVQSLN